MKRKKSSSIGGIILILLATFVVAAAYPQLLWIFGAIVVLSVIIIPTIKNHQEHRRQRKQEEFIENIVPQILSTYDKITEFDIADADYALMRVSPFDENRHLLYALRISKCLPTLKKLDTLASRYNTTCYGAGGSGLLAGKYSSRYQSVADFLEKRYLSKYIELADEQIIQKSKITESKRKTKAAKINVWSEALEKLKDSKKVFEHKLSGLDDAVEALKTQIESEIERLNLGVDN